MRAIILISILVPVNTAVNPIRYLQRYGYLEIEQGIADADETVESPTTDMSHQYQSALRKMQHMFGLSVTGYLNSATRDVMEVDRCGMKDVHVSRHRRHTYAHEREFTAEPITYRVGSGDLSDLTKAAVDIWTMKTGLVFEMNDQEADILIEWKAPRHTVNGNDETFGQNDIVHVTDPTDSSRIGEVHINIDKPLWSNVTQSTHRETSLLAVIVHGLGHLLRLHHTSDKTDIMFPIMQPGPINITDKDRDHIRDIWGHGVHLSKTTSKPAPGCKNDTRCPDGWYYDEYRTHKCYKTMWYIPNHSPENHTFERADERCGEMAEGGRLASIHSRSELDVVQGLITLRFAGSDWTMTWIGLRKAGGELAWSDGTPFDYRPYKVADNGADCIAARYFAPRQEWVWKAVECDSSWSFICKAPPTDSLPPF